MHCGGELQALRAVQDAAGVLESIGVLQGIAGFEGITGTAGGIARDCSQSFAGIAELRYSGIAVPRYSGTAGSEIACSVERRPAGRLCGAPLSRTVSAGCANDYRGHMTHILSYKTHTVI
jgi:hypothetical protein